MNTAVTAQLEQIKEQVVTFLQTEIFDASVRIEADTDLFDNGFDSFSLVKLIVFVENQFHLRIPEEQLTETTLKDANRISEMIHALQKS
jgi:acyl carrier protein